MGDWSFQYAISFELANCPKLKTIEFGGYTLEYLTTFTLKSMKCFDVLND